MDSFPSSQETNGGACDSEPLHDILVYGCAYTPYYDTEDETTTLFKSSDMTREFAEKVKGLPVYIEHDNSVPIGNVHSAHINERRQLMTLLHIYNNDAAKERLPGTFYADPESGKRYFNAFSLGNDVGFTKDENQGIQIVQNVPSEVSLVMAGNRPMTEISDYWFLPKESHVDEFVNTHVDISNKLKPFY